MTRMVKVTVKKTITATIEMDDEWFEESSNPMEAVLALKEWSGLDLDFADIHDEETEVIAARLAPSPTKAEGE